MLLHLLFPYVATERTADVSAVDPKYFATNTADIMADIIADITFEVFPQSGNLKVSASSAEPLYQINNNFFDTNN